MRAKRMKKQEQKNVESSPKKPMKKSRAALYLGILSAIFLLLTIGGILFFWEYLSDAEAVRTAIGEHYLLGAIALIFICAFQVIVALVPGELVETAAGYVFGEWWGLLLCLAGITLGSIIVILLARLIGKKFVYTFYPKEKLDRLPILNDPRKRNNLTFILFLIPGTPKDMLTYAIGLTDMKIPVYLALTTAARIPSIITSTMAGGALGDKDPLRAAIVFGVTAVLSLIGLIIYNIIQKRHESKRAAEAAELAEAEDASSPIETAALDLEASEAEAGEFAVAKEVTEAADEAEKVTEETTSASLTDREDK